MPDIDSHPLLAREIKLYRSMTPGDEDYVAVISGLGFMFRAGSAFKAKKKAETWRRIEAEKLVLGPKKAAARAAAREAAE